MEFYFRVFFVLSLVDIILFVCLEVVIIFLFCIIMVFSDVDDIVKKICLVSLLLSV